MAALIKTTVWRNVNGDGKRSEHAISVHSAQSGLNIESLRSGVGDLIAMPSGGHVSFEFWTVHESEVDRLSLVAFWYSPVTDNRPIVVAFTEPRSFQRNVVDSL